MILHESGLGYDLGWPKIVPDSRKLIFGQYRYRNEFIAELKSILFSRLRKIVLKINYANIRFICSENQYVLYQNVGILACI